LRSLAEYVHGLSLQAIRWAIGISLLFFVVALPVLLLGGPRAGRWIGLPGFWAISAVLIAAGTASFAKAILDAADESAGRGRRVALPMLHVVLGTLYLAGGCGGLWAFTVRTLHGGGS
jgi:hypothetical protein